MHATIQFGAYRLHWIPVVPGRPREGARVVQALSEVKATVVAAAIPPAHLIALAADKREPAPYRFLLEETERRFRTTGSDDPFRAAHRWARRTDADVHALLPRVARTPGWFERRALRRRVREIPQVGDALGFLRAYLEVTHSADALEAAYDAAAAALARIAFDEGAYRAAALVPEPWAGEILARIQARAPRPPREREAPREVARVEEVEPQ